MEPSFVKIEDVPHLPRVLLIGDSISMGYTLEVRRLLKEKANVHRPAANCGDTGKGLANIREWLGSKPWKVIHFNFGLHDLKYVDDKNVIAEVNVGKQVRGVREYQANLRQILEVLRETGARLIFATTTPIPPFAIGRTRGDEKIYNEAAIGVMKDQGVELNDLWKFVDDIQKNLPSLPNLEKPEMRKGATMRSGDIQLPYDVHYTEAGYARMAEQVARHIAKHLG